MIDHRYSRFLRMKVTNRNTHAEPLPLTAPQNYRNLQLAAFQHRQAVMAASVLH